MKTITIGDFIQITKNVRLYIEDVEIEIENGEITVFFICYEIQEDGSTSQSRPLLQSQIEELLKY